MTTGQKKNKLDKMCLLKMFCPAIDVIPIDSGRNSKETWLCLGGNGSVKAEVEVEQ
jgi:hypothetical protein